MEADPKRLGQFIKVGYKYYCVHFEYRDIQTHPQNLHGSAIY